MSRTDTVVSSPSLITLRFNDDAVERSFVADSFSKLRSTHAALLLVAICVAVVRLAMATDSETTALAWVGLVCDALQLVARVVVGLMAGDDRAREQRLGSRCFLVLFVGHVAAVSNRAGSDATEVRLLEGLAHVAALHLWLVPAELRMLFAAGLRQPPRSLTSLNRSGRHDGSSSASNPASPPRRGPRAFLRSMGPPWGCLAAGGGGGALLSQRCCCVCWLPSSERCDSPFDPAGSCAMGCATERWSSAVYATSALIRLAKCVRTDGSSSAVWTHSSASVGWVAAQIPTLRPSCSMRRSASLIVFAQAAAASGS